MTSHLGDSGTLEKNNEYNVLKLYNNVVSNDITFTGVKNIYFLNRWHNFFLFQKTILERKLNLIKINM
jgi:hypothetical protein